jgi:hypothetical protein
VTQLVIMSNGSYIRNGQTKCYLPVEPVSLNNVTNYHRGTGRGCRRFIVNQQNMCVDDCSGIPQYLQANADIHIKMDHDRFLPRPLQFTVP